MIWGSDSFKQASAALEELGSVTAAADAVGTTPKAMADAFRRAGYAPPNSFIVGAKTTNTDPVINIDIPATRKWDRQKSKPHTRNHAKDTKVYAICSDVHVPYHSPGAHLAFCDFLNDLRPDGLVVNGDFLDLVEVSRHSSASVAQLEGLRISKTFDAGNRVLDDYFLAAGKKCLHNHFVEGNHENRLARWLTQGDNAVWIGDEGVSIAHRLRFRERNIAYHEGYPEAHVTLGHLKITHGRWTPKYSAAVHLDRWQHSVLIGHVHTAQMFHGSGFDKQRAAFSTGHMADPNSSVMKYAPKPNSWCQGFAVVTIEATGAFHTQLIQFVNGRFVYGNKTYGNRKRG